MELLDFKSVKMDSLEFMRTLPDNSIKLIITSPPYDIGKKYEHCKTVDDYLFGMKPIITEMYRILAEYSSICWEVGDYVTKRNRFFHDILSLEFNP